MVHLSQKNFAELRYFRASPHIIFLIRQSCKNFCDDTPTFLDIYGRRSDGAGCLRQLHHVLADSHKVICLIDTVSCLLYRMGKDEYLCQKTINLRR